MFVNRTLIQQSELSGSLLFSSTVDVQVLLPRRHRALRHASTSDAYIPQRSHSTPSSAEASTCIDQLLTLIVSHTSYPTAPPASKTVRHRKGYHTRDGDLVVVLCACGRPCLNDREHLVSVQICIRG